MVFELLSNFIENSIFAISLIKFANIQQKKDFFISTVFFSSLLVYLFNSNNMYGIEVTLSVQLAFILSIYFLKKQLKLSYIMFSLLVNIELIFSVFITMKFISLLTNIHFILIYERIFLYYGATFLSKILFISFVVLTFRIMNVLDQRVIKERIELKLKKWAYLALIEILLLIGAVYILSCVFFLKEVDLILIVVLIFTIAVLFVFIFLRINILNQDYVNMVKKNDQQRLRLSNQFIIKNSKYEIDMISHDFMHILSLIEKDSEYRNEYIKTEIKKIKQKYIRNNIIVTTNNELFDFTMTQILRKLALFNSKMKFVINISKNEIYDCNYFLKVINIIGDMDSKLIDEIVIQEKVNNIIIDLVIDYSICEQMRMKFNMKDIEFKEVSKMNENKVRIRGVILNNDKLLD